MGTLLNKVVEDLIKCRYEIKYQEEGKAVILEKEDFVFIYTAYVKKELGKVTIEISYK